MERVQRIVRTATRPEAIGEAQEVRLPDRLQNEHHRLLDDLVLQAEDTQWPLRAVRLRDVSPSRRPGPITAPVYPGVQFRQLLVEVFSVGSPRHPVDPRRGIPLQREVAPFQKLDGEVMQQRGELYTRTLSRRSAHSRQSRRHGDPALSPDRGSLTAVPLGRGPSLHGLRRERTPVVRPLQRYYYLVLLLARVHAHRSVLPFMNRPGMPHRARTRSPRFRTKDVSTCMGSATARGSSHACHPAHGAMLPSRQRNGSAPRKGQFRSSIPSPWHPL